MLNVIDTTLDTAGNIMKKKGDINIQVLQLTKNPFDWIKYVNDATFNCDKEFTKDFLESNNLDFEKLQTVSTWFPYYYATFLINVGSVTTFFESDSIKAKLKDRFKDHFNVDKNQKYLNTLIDNIPSNINSNTKFEELSDIFSFLTNLDFTLLTLEEN